MVVNRALMQGLGEEGVGWQWGCCLPYKALTGTGGSIWVAEEDQALPRNEAQCSVRCKDAR